MTFMQSLAREEFEILVAEEFPNAIPEKFRDKIKNVAFLVEGDPSSSLRAQEGLRPHETLLGFYRGIPHTARGDYYGVGSTMPDTITLYQNPIESEAAEVYQRQKALQESAPGRSAKSYSLEELFDACVRRVIRDTIWHEVAHHFGMDEPAVRAREKKRRSK
jgi:predicted Zn-dependent protease with MMP-like domain